MAATTDPVGAVEQDAFVAEFRHRRDISGLSRTALAQVMGYSRSYVSKVESGAERPSREFAAAADAALNAGGALKRAWRERPTTRRQPLPEASTGSASALVVAHDDAELVYDHSRACYRATMRRSLVNAGAEPITRYLIRISVDRFPGNPELSNELYRADPLTWSELDLHAWHGEHRAEPMRWVTQHDRDAFKEVWLLFANEDGQFPLYPGESTVIEYSYTVSAAKWGRWFRRSVRLPTRRLSVRLDFPSDLDPAVWGLHTSMTAESAPFATAIERQDTGERRVFSWSTEDPPLHARYRLEWNFRAASNREHADRPSERMSALGIVQADEPILTTPAREFRLPDEAEDARRVISELQSAVRRVAEVHPFRKGLGIAAPQIGIDRTVAVVRPAGAIELITLLNPRVVDASDQCTEHYEGCLSFFDVRGLVPRPLTIHVEHRDITGAPRITIFDRGLARLVAHEIDHLDGRLYIDRMRPGVTPIPVEAYDGTGAAWRY